MAYILYFLGPYVWWGVKGVKKRVEWSILFALAAIGSLILVSLLFLSPFLMGAPLMDSSPPPPDEELPEQDVFMEVEPPTRIRTNESVVVEFTIINYNDSRLPANCSVETDLPADTDVLVRNVTLKPNSYDTCSVRFNSTEVEPDTDYDVLGYVTVGDTGDKRLVRREVVHGGADRTEGEPTLTPSTVMPSQGATTPTPPDQNRGDLVDLFRSFGITALFTGSLVGAFLLTGLSIFNLCGSKIYESETLKSSLEIGLGTGGTIGLAVSLDESRAFAVNTLSFSELGWIYLSSLVVVLVTATLSGTALLLSEYAFHWLARARS